jgi:ketosteroid isomerase-like protein
MSEENVEILSHVYEAWNRRDFEDVLRYMDPEVEFNPGLLPPGEDTAYRGHEGVREWLRQLDTWVAVTVESSEQIEITGGRVLAIDRWLFEGRDGIEIEEELPTVFTFRDGLIVRVDGFRDRAEAFRAAALSE